MSLVELKEIDDEICVYILMKIKCTIQDFLEYMMFNKVIASRLSWEDFHIISDYRATNGFGRLDVFSEDCNHSCFDARAILMNYKSTVYRESYDEMYLESTCNMIRRAPGFNYYRNITYYDGKILEVTQESYKFHNEIPSYLLTENLPDKFHKIYKVYEIMYAYEIIYDLSILHILEKTKVPRHNDDLWVGVNSFGSLFFILHPEKLTMDHTKFSFEQGFYASIRKNKYLNKYSKRMRYNRTIALLAK